MVAKQKKAGLGAAVKEFVDRAERWESEHPRLPDDEPFVDLPIGGPRPWLVTARFVVREGRPVIRDLHVVATNKQRRKSWDIPATGLSTSHLRKVHMPGAIRSDRVAELFAESGVAVVGGIKGRAPKAKNAYTDDQIASFAADYIAVAAKGHPNPRKTLREKYQAKGDLVPASYVPDMIRRAVDRGFLSEAQYAGDRTPRRATPKLDAWTAAHRPPRKSRQPKKE